MARCRRVLKFLPPNVHFERRGWPVLTQPGQLRRFLAQAGSGPFQAIYCPLESGLLEEHFEYVGRMCLAAQDLVLYVDEIDMLCSPNGLAPIKSAFYNHPDRKYLTPILGEILNRGRHRGVAMVMLSRMPAQVNRLVTQSCSEMRIFRQSEPNVLAYFGKVSPTLAGMLPHLADFEYVLWQDGKSPICAGGRKRKNP